MATRVFISYRRGDSAASAGRIHDRLERELGRDVLFMDVDGIPLGANFIKVLRNEVSSCNVLLAVIGPGWLNVRNEDGSRRLDDPDDFVRVEIATALQRDIPVIPILLDETKIPRSALLPDELKELAVRNALDIRHASFHSDMDRLVLELKRELVNRTNTPTTSPVQEKRELEPKIAALQQERREETKPEENVRKSIPEQQARVRADDARSEEAKARQKPAAEQHLRTEAVAKAPTDVRERPQTSEAAASAEKKTQVASNATPTSRLNRPAVAFVAGLLILSAIAAVIYNFGSPPAPIVPSATTPASQPKPAAPGAQSAGVSQPSNVGASATPAAAPQAIFYEEAANNPRGTRLNGSITWRTETSSSGPGLAAALAVRADVTIPERKMTVNWTLRRNTDKALPASHTIEIMFNLPADFPGGGVANVPGVLMKDSEEARGVPLAGLAVKVTNNFFLVGLSEQDADMKQNMATLKNRLWFDIPIVYNNGGRAILAMEKGPPGARAFADAFAAWSK
jgi:hypothetical protein